MKYKIGDKFTLYKKMELGDTYECMVPFLVTSIIKDNALGNSWVFDGGYTANKIDKWNFSRTPKGAPLFLEYRKYKEGDEERVAATCAFITLVQNVEKSLRILYKKYPTFLRSDSRVLGDYDAMSSVLFLTLKKAVDAPKSSKR